MPSVRQITIYPIKSLDGIVLPKARVAEGGCLYHDREFAMMDQNGNFINGKANPRVHLLRSGFDPEITTVSFRHQEEKNWKQFHLLDQKDEIERYLSEFFHQHVFLLRNSSGRFLDVPDISGITLVATASLEAVAGWYDTMNKEEAEKRFRASIEIEDVPAFWEDHLFKDQQTGVAFKIGDVTLLGISPRERCVVPTRHPLTGEVTYAFAKTFSAKRKASLPQASTMEKFGHYYHLSVDCKFSAADAGKWIHVGDTLSILGEREISLT